ncbi:MAG: protease inhibitor I42 family protein [Limisphaerales bacterium]
MKNSRRGSLPLAALLVVVVIPSAMVNVGAQTPPTPETLVLTETNNGAIVQAVLQQPITINLFDNPSTPLGWLFLSASGTSVVSNGPPVYIPDLPVIPGSPGTLVWSYLAVSPGPATLSFAYCQVFDPQLVLTNYTVTIDVQPMPPVLSLTLAGENVLITWPITNSAGFFLEGTASLQPAQWAALNVIPLPDGQNYRVTLGHLGPPLFFRLHKQ